MTATTSDQRRKETQKKREGDRESRQERWQRGEGGTFPEAGTSCRVCPRRSSATVHRARIVRSAHASKKTPQPKRNARIARSAVVFFSARTRRGTRDVAAFIVSRVVRLRVCGLLADREYLAVVRRWISRGLLDTVLLRVGRESEPSPRVRPIYPEW